MATFTRSVTNNAGATNAATRQVSLNRVANSGSVAIALSEAVANRASSANSVARARVYGSSITNNAATANAVTQLPVSSGIFSGSPQYLTLSMPSSPPLSANSAAIISALTGSGTKGPVLDIYQFGYGIVENTSGATPTTTCTVAEDPAWGNSALVGAAIPWFPNAKPAAGSDGHLAIVDHVQGLVFDMWETTVDVAHGIYKCTWGGAYPFSGVGVLPSGQGTGSGCSTLFGPIRISEVIARLIPHALCASSSLTNPSIVTPALSSDGQGSGTASLGEGSKIILPSSVNIGAISGLSAISKAILTALQDFGCYIVDSGGATLAIVAECPTQVGVTDPWAAAGIPDFWGMTDVPQSVWNALKVVNTWNGR